MKFLGVVFGIPLVAGMLAEGVCTYPASACRDMAGGLMFVVGIACLAAFVMSEEHKPR